MVEYTGVGAVEAHRGAGNVPDRSPIDDEIDDAHVAAAVRTRKRQGIEQASKQRTSRTYLALPVSQHWCSAPIRPSSLLSEIFILRNSNTEI